ncbi:MAG: UDP-N-acetylmuramoyl-L-alanine--D-glutamate ligase [Coriobacteriia bacterium]|nr:UDP-N-acetylmuramoyl-L-alanine--D-glutamate ligase [Coriobacteriia bacterium]
MGGPVARGADERARRVLVLGLGRSGRATARYLAARAATGEPVAVSVVDEADTGELRAAADELRALGVEVALGAAEAPPAELVVASPGIPPSSRLMRSAAALGVPVVSEVEFAFARSRSPWVAVTGTNGKTTVTCLAAHLLACSGVPVETVGNIGTPPISVVEAAGEATVLVAEVSSFQLAATAAFRPRVAVLLNITPDHLDWHDGMAGYAADKARVFANQGPDDFAVVVVDDPGAAPYADEVAARGVRVCRVSLREWHAGGAGLLDGDLALDSPEGPVRLIPVDELPLPGRHNVLNALAAAAAAAETGATAEGVREGLRTFRPVPHRLEAVAVVAGVEYVDDSKATNPDAVVKALEAFEDRPVVALLGGYPKRTGFGQMARAVAAHARAAVLFGEAADEIARAFEGLDVRVERAGRLAEAVGRAAAAADPGDVVLLAPGCASFDEFSSYAERGEAFADAVRALSEGERDV